MLRGLTVIAAAVAVLVLLGWIGGEMHYRNCLAKADMRYPVAESVEGNKYLGEPSDPFSDPDLRRAALAECSRRPWS